MQKNTPQPTLPTGLTPSAPASMPDFLASTGAGALNLKDYNVKYLKIDMDDITGKTELEVIESRSLRGDGILLIDKDKFTFMDKYFVIARYLEIDRTVPTR